MLGAENGIIKQAQKSKKETVIGEEKEYINLAYSSASIKKINQEDKVVYATDLQEELAKITGDNNRINCTTSEENNGIIQVIFTDTKNKYLVDAKGSIEHKKALGYPTFATETTLANYGDYVNYSIDYDKDGDTSDDWRIFYNDGECIYLIASDYVILDEFATSYYGDSLILEGIAEVTSVDEAIIFLQDKEKWTNILGDEMVKYAVGATTIQMFADSWNQKHPDKKMYLSKGENGYYMGKTENPTSNSFGGEDDLYFFRKGSLSTYLTMGMWIASKSGNSFLIRTLDNTCDGTIDNINGRLYVNGFNGYYNGIRPIVCLKPEVILQSGEGTIDNPFEIELKQ